MSEILDNAYNAAKELAALCDDLLRMARGEQPNNLQGLTHEELLDYAERTCNLVAQSRRTQIPLIDLAASLLPHSASSIEVGGAHGDSYHWAVASLSVQIGGELIQARMLGSVVKPGAGFADWWPLAAEVLAARPPVILDQIHQSLRAEWYNAEAKEPKSLKNKSNSATRRRPGRKKRPTWVIESEAKLAKAWNVARQAGTYKGDFAGDNNITMRELDLLLGRVSKQKSRSDN